MANVQTLTLPKNDDSDLRAELERLRAENAALKSTAKKHGFKLTGDNAATYTGTVQIVNLRKIAPSFHPGELDVIYSDDMIAAWKSFKASNVAEFAAFAADRDLYKARREARSAAYAAKV